MYKRHALGDDERATGTPATVFTFFAFLSAIVWLVPLGIEIVFDSEIEMLMMPPSWRAEIMCHPPPDDANSKCSYIHADGICTSVPGQHCKGDQTHNENEETQRDINLLRAREGLDLYDIYTLVFDGLRWGTVLAAGISMVIMRVGRQAWTWVWVPCGSMVAVTVIHPEAYPLLLAAALPVHAAAYAADMWSTSRFGIEHLRKFEFSPMLRYFIRYGMARAFAYHTAASVGIVASLASAMTIWGPLPWDASLGMVSFGMATMHLWAIRNNIGWYRLVEAER